MVCVSLLFAGWLGGVPIGLMDFLPQAIGFFFIVWNCGTKTHLQALIAVMVSAVVALIIAAGETVPSFVGWLLSLRPVVSCRPVPSAALR